jgi:hypothetical protein
MNKSEENLDGKYYCDCTNDECPTSLTILDPDEPCPECESKLEPSDCEGGW